MSVEVHGRELTCVVCVSDVFWFLCKQKTAYEMRISDWSSDVCSSDLFDFLAIPAAHLRTGIAEREVDDIAGSKELAHQLQAVAFVHPGIQDRKSVVSGQSVSVRVDLGGRRIIKKQVTQSACEQCLELCSSEIVIISGPKNEQTT